MRDALAAHAAACGEREALEERRLLYVAATRAEDLLICTGYWWGTGSSLRGPSVFLTEIRDACAALGGDAAAASDGGWAPCPAEGETNPRDAEGRASRWPQDPLTAGRRAALEDGVRRVRAAETRTADVSGPVGAADTERATAWVEEVTKLLAERAGLRENSGPAEVALPAHLSVSQLVALHKNPDELARWIRRPLPLPPAPLARRGTAFHAWLEGRFQGGRLLDIDELPGAADADAAIDGDLDVLKEAFLASEWAQRQPIEVEVPFETLIQDVLVRGRADAVFRQRADPRRLSSMSSWTGRPADAPRARTPAPRPCSWRPTASLGTGSPAPRWSASAPPSTTCATE